jgi:isoleucyl-tRNA synthetase
MAIPKFPELEEKILKDWDEKDIFKKTLGKPSPKGNFVFFEGPPTANGKPGIHHLIARVFKDCILRYKTMRGYYVERKSGWDTHGLPVEIAVEKQLGFKSKLDIEAYGIAPFNEKCRESVWEYKNIWEKFTKRCGYWLDLEHPYITYDKNYMETLWWITKKINDRGLLYEDFKVVPHCPRCGTTLSSHELAQGYDEVDDPSVYLRFKIKDGKFVGACFLVWTTTPWTLPANTALAVGKGIKYSLVEFANGEKLVLASARLGVLDGEFKMLEEFAGEELVGVSYEPLFDFLPYKEKAHYVLPADFVSTAEGTGIVHIAPMYGVDDFNVGAAAGLPKQHLVNERGEFIPEVKPWAGMFVKKADPLIIEYFKDRGILYKQEKIRHTYPFCWRCKTPLLYYAKPCWYFKTSAVADEMIAANQKINWVPEHLRDGRFGEWLKNLKDWAVTRERYWATPLPVWKCAAGHATVAGSFDELSERSFNAPVNLILVRHAEATSNAEGFVYSGLEGNGSHITEKGKKEAASLAKKLGKKKPAAIYSSPVARAKETAQMIAEETGLSVGVDDRLHEIDFGVMNGKTDAEYDAFYEKREDRWIKAPKGGETWVDLRKRLVAFVKDMRARHPGETVVVVSHGDPLYILKRILKNDWAEGPLPELASAEEIPAPNFSWNEEGELDVHRPYIDEVSLKCATCGEKAGRVKDVMDVWFDSGSMPFAEWHYPFENKERVDKGVSFPADFISEAIDQTRGWFYTLLAVSTLLGYKEAPYKNVICMNHILDAKGKKMSKSVGNVVDPWEMFERYGSDAVRFFLYTANQPGDNKLFDEKDVDGVVKKVFLILWNTMEFWKLSRGTNDEQRGTDNEHVLDRWLSSRSGKLIKDVTEHLDAYHLTEPGRELMEFVNELSTWYVRRSRDRFRAGASVEPLRQAILTAAKLLAPFTPLVAEAIYGEAGGELESVHLADWPEYKEKEIDLDLIADMDTVRHIVELGHSLRDEAKVKLRQPLAEVEIEKAAIKDLDELMPVVAEELNVKAARSVEKIETRAGWIIKEANGLKIALRTEITQELKREGWMREIMRQVNDLRKEAKLTPADRVKLYFDVDDIEFKSILTTEKEHLAASARADEVLMEKGKIDVSRELDFEGKKLWIGIKKVA